MIKDLKLSKVKSKAIKIDDTYIDDKYINDFIYDIEIESNYFRPNVNGCMTVCGDLFSLSIGRSPETLKDTKITIYIEDEGNEVFAKEFFVVSSVKAQVSPSKNTWVITLIDVYGKYLVSKEYTDRITKHGYTGKPLEIVEQAINDLIPNKYADCDIRFIRNKVYFIDDNNVSITHRFVNELSPIDNLLNLCDMYNIHMYQSNTLYFIQNPTLQNANVLTANDGTSLYSEVCKNNLYECKVCDKIKQNNSIDNLDRVNYKISVNDIAKRHTYKLLNFNDFISILLLNNNIHDFKDYINEKYTYTPSSVSTLSSLVYENYKKYLKANTLTIYTRSTFDKVNVGDVVTVDLRSEDKFARDRAKGDVRYSGKWLITSTTMKVVNDMCFFRLRLNRFDNPQEERLTNVISNGDVKDDIKTIDEAKSKRNQILLDMRLK